MPREAGIITVTDPGIDRFIQEVGTLQCCHCQAHWTLKPGSGNVRGFCFKCNGPVCGPKCAGKCVPAEQMLENMETGRSDDYMPIQSAVKLWVPGDD
jgi:hypothetical protein